MFFNLDREKKQRILNYYKNSALDSRKKKEAAKGGEETSNPRRIELFTLKRKRRARNRE